MNRKHILTVTALSMALAATPALLAASNATTPRPSTQHTAAGNVFLSDPFLQHATPTAVSVVWFTEHPGRTNVVAVGGLFPGSGPAPGRMVHAETTTMSRTAEDHNSPLPENIRPSQEAGIVKRTIYRHEARVTNLKPGVRVPYQVMSITSAGVATSNTFTLQGAPTADQDVNFLITSDHQMKNNTPANLQWAQKTIGDIDAVLFPGDLVNVPDRASEWFDADHQKAFFPGLQGTTQYKASNGNTYTGGQIIQHAPLYPVIGNHEVMGNSVLHRDLTAQYQNPVPKNIAEAEYNKVATDVNPSGDPAIKANWLKENSYNTDTYEELFTLPQSKTGGEQYYATTIGNTRIIALYATRIWRGHTANTNPADRTKSSRYQEAAQHLDNPLAQSYGQFPFKAIGVGSAQHDWLQQELQSAETTSAKHVVLMMHESPQTVGDNPIPHFGTPDRIEERDEAGNLTGVRYEYPAENNVLINDVMPLIEDSPVDLVINGHSHLWNRATSPKGTHFMESSNVGNSYGAYVPSSGKERPTPPAPWNASNYLTQGAPYGLKPVVPTVNPLRSEDGTPQPYVASNDYSVFSSLNSTTGDVTSWIVDMKDPNATPQVLDVFNLDKKSPADQ